MTQTGPVTLTVLTNGPSPADQLTDLVALGRERGSLTMADVMVALDRADLPPEAIDAAVRALADEGVDVLDVPLQDWGIAPDQPYIMHDLLSDDRFTWRGSSNWVRLDPNVQAAHIFRVEIPHY